MARMPQVIIQNIRAEAESDLAGAASRKASQRGFLRWNSPIHEILSDIYRMPTLLRLNLPLSTDFGNANSSTRALVHPSQRHWRAERRKSGFCCHPDAPLPCILIGRATTNVSRRRRIRRRPQLRDQPQDVSEQMP